MALPPSTVPSGYLAGSCVLDTSFIVHLPPDRTILPSESNSPTCKDAQPGWFAPGYGSTKESQCVPGYYSMGLAAECTICPAGSHCNGYTNTRPQLCEPGRYSSKPGAGQDCDLCPPGQFSNIEGATACCSWCVVSAVRPRGRADRRP